MDPKKEWAMFTGSQNAQTRSIDNANLIQRLKKPTGIVDVVLDTDTYNEIDDQYALAYMIKSSEKLNPKAIYAAPFFNFKSSSPEDGMEKSYSEILNVLELMDREDLKPIVHKGSRRFLLDENTPERSEAVEDLIRLSKSYSKEKPLYVISIGAITNIASAILLDPEIIDRIVVIWLGGHAVHWPNNKEFNLCHDVAAARIIFGCGVPLVQLPCMGVVSAFTTSGPELEYHLRGKNKLCDYLIDVTEEAARISYGEKVWTRPIWDVTAVAWLLDGDFEEDCLMASPIPEYDDHYAFNPNRHLIKYVYNIKRDNLFGDLFEKLSRK